VPRLTAGDPSAVSGLNTAPGTCPVRPLAASHRAAGAIAPEPELKGRPAGTARGRGSALHASDRLPRGTYPIGVYLGQGHLSVPFQ
jgi:hypothetical protein